MFDHMVVPLDGSHLAEAALPVAAYLADQLGASVTLLHIIERDAPEEVHGERHLRRPEEAVAYLDQVAQRAFPAAVKVARHVHTEEMANIPRSIAAHSHELGPDLIVMCTHGRGGLSDLLYGNIAQQVVAQGVTPVLLVPPAESELPPVFQIRRLLVTLDGNAEHEDGLPASAVVGRACSAVVQLLLVVPTLGTLAGGAAATGMFLPGTTRAVLELAEQDAASYLRRHMADLSAQGVTATAFVARGDPATVIVETAHSLDADILVLGTHAKAGTAAFWSGSLSPKISSRLRLPLLLVPHVQKPPPAG
jgi:nucleotide-binding universal stress UspA family protein